MLPVLATVLSPRPVVQSMVLFYSPRIVTNCTNLQRNGRKNCPEHRFPRPTEVAKWPRDRARKCRRRKRLGLAASRVTTISFQYARQDLNLQPSVPKTDGRFA